MGESNTFLEPVYTLGQWAAIGPYKVRRGEFKGQCVVLDPLGAVVLDGLKHCRADELCGRLNRAFFLGRTAGVEWARRRALRVVPLEWGLE